MTQSIIIGSGEIGKALYKVLKDTHDIVIRDTEPLEVDKVNVMHICFPYSEGFCGYVEAYKKEYNPDFTVIHSTIPVGTATKCGAFHSPVRGVHPNLEGGIRTFVKYLAPRNLELADYFKKAGIKIKQLEKPEITELAKMLSTTYYGLAIAYHSYAKKLIDKTGTGFESVMTEFNTTYNQGYKELGMDNVVRPVLYAPTKGGKKGHCVLENKALLKEQFGDDVILKAIAKHFGDEETND